MSDLNVILDDDHDAAKTEGRAASLEHVVSPVVGLDNFHSVSPNEKRKRWTYRAIQFMLCPASSIVSSGTSVGYGTQWPSSAGREHTLGMLKSHTLIFNRFFFETRLFI
jgi:hypothetical protein